MKNLKLLSNEEIIQKISPNLVQKGGDIMHDDYLILTNKRIIVTYESKGSQENKYYVNLKDITALSIVRKTGLIPAIVFFVFVIIVSGISETVSRSGGVLIGIALVIGLIVTGLIYYFGNRFGIEISIPGFTGTRVSQGSRSLWIVVILGFIVFPIIGLVLLLVFRQKLFKGKSVSNGGLFFEVDSNFDYETLNQFVDNFYEYKEKYMDSDSKVQIIKDDNYENKLMELQKLLDKGLINEEEFNLKRKEIINRM